MIDLNVRCDNKHCNKSLGDGDEVTCAGCVNDMESKIDDLNDRIKELEAELEKERNP